MPVNKQDAQAFGSACTYGRRYGLQSMCGVPSEDDDGDRATKAQSFPKNTIVPTTGLWDKLNDQQKSRLTDLVTVVKEYLADQDIAQACKTIDDYGLDADEKSAMWSRFDSKQRAAMKKYKEQEIQL